RRAPQRVPAGRGEHRAGHLGISDGRCARRGRVARCRARLANVRLTCLNRGMDTPATGSAASARGNNLTYGILAGVAVVGIIFAFSGSAVLPNNWYSLFKAIHVTFSLILVGGGVSI